uniref:OTU domain-containing protein n=1 Tax=Callorhinchus milii TaxID=7868 RepID=A0A4W3HT04_CALMI
MYKRDFIIYQEANRPPASVTENGFPDQILLCFSNGNHYDSVYPRSFIDDAALCQSILYEMLYQNVLETDVSSVIPVLDANGETSEDYPNTSEDSNSDSDTELGLLGKVLRAFNPNIYRNVEYDVWLKSKRAQQKRDYSIAAGMQYSVGDRCKVRLDNGKCYNAHIQEVSPDNGPVVLFVEELGEKKCTILLTEGEFRGPKNSSNFTNKPNRAQTTLPPRLQQTTGGRQQNPPQQVAAVQPKQLPSSLSCRKCDRGQEGDGSNKDPRRFDPSEADEAQAPFVIQLKDEQSFPALPVSRTLGFVHLVYFAQLQMAIPPETPSPVTCSPPASHTAQVMSPAVTPLCVPLPPGNLPAVHVPQIPNPYQDLLYPGFPVNEKGEYLNTSPAYSYDKSGRDLPEDKSILRFFYNLGVKAFSFPLWTPYSYLYALNQAYTKTCAMYPRGPAPVLPINPWLQATVDYIQSANTATPPLIPSPPETHNPSQSVQLEESINRDHLSPAQPMMSHLAQKNESALNLEALHQNFHLSFPSHLPSHMGSDGNQPPVGWRTPLPQALFGRSPYVHPFSIHPMYVAALGSGLPCQVSPEHLAYQNDPTFCSSDPCVQQLQSEEQNLVPDASLPGSDIVGENVESPKITGTCRENSGIAGAPLDESESQSAQTFQTTDGAKVKSVPCTTAVTSMSGRSEVHNEMSTTAPGGRPIYFYNQGWGENRDDSKQGCPPKRPLHHQMTYVPKQRDVSDRAKWQRKPYSSYNSYANGRDRTADPKRQDSKLYTKDRNTWGTQRGTKRSGLPRGASADGDESKHENVQGRLQIQRHHMGPNRFDVKRGLGNEQDNDVQQFENEAAVENESGKHNGFRKQGYRESRKPNPSIRKQ